MPPKDSEDDDSVEGDINDALKDPAADWGKAKYDYYYTDYIDKDYPSSLTAKEERLAKLEQEEALRIQKRLLSTLDNINYQVAIDEEAEQEHDEREGNVIDFIETQNKRILAAKDKLLSKNDETDRQKRKRVKFDAESNSSEGESDGDGGESDLDGPEEEPSRRRRPIDMAIQKNRGLTPYKKKEYRNPRVKHKLKYKKAMSKRRHLVKEAQVEYHRYSGETTGIKTSTIRSIRLC